MQQKKKKKKNWRKKVIECFFLIEVQVISNPSSRLEKNPNQTPEYLLMNKFCDFFYHRTKIIVCVLFHVNLLDQTQYSLISSFLMVILSRLVSASGFNLELQRSIFFNTIKSIYNE